METDNKQICQTCLFFRQHYIWQGYRYNAINYGHCRQGIRVKHLHALKSACDKWQQQDEQYKKCYEPAE